LACGRKKVKKVMKFRANAISVWYNINIRKEGISLSSKKR